MHSPCMWDYAVYGIDVSAALYHKFQALDWAIKGITTDFKTNSNHSFDTTQPCYVCAGVGHNFFNCSELQDSDKVKQAYIHLCVAFTWFLTYVKKVCGDSDLHTLAAISMCSLERISRMQHSSTQPALPFSTTTNVAGVLVSTLCGISQQL